MRCVEFDGMDGVINHVNEKSKIRKNENPSNTTRDVYGIKQILKYKMTK